MRAWGQAFRIPTAGRGRAQASIGMSCQPLAGYEREMFSAGCTMNIGLKKLLREVASTFCGAQLLYSDRSGIFCQLTNDRPTQRTSRKFVLTGRIFRAKLSGQVGLPLRIDLSISFPLVVGETAFALILSRPLGSWAPLVEDQLSNFL